MDNPSPTFPRKRSQSNGLIHDAAINNSPFSSELSHAGESSSPLQAVPIFKLKDPRPDTCIGLSDNSLIKVFEPGMRSSAARIFSFGLQDTAALVSGPHVIPLGLRFLFFIVEAKAGATGGNIYQAQNQAAVGGSTALQILRNLSELKYAQNLERKFIMAPTPARGHLRACPTSHQTWSFLHYGMPDLRIVGFISRDTTKRIFTWIALGRGGQPWKTTLGTFYAISRQC